MIPIIKKQILFERKQKYTIKRVLEKTVFEDKKKNPALKDFDGDMIKMSSDRYKCFSLHGIKCCKCGIEGKYFVKERHEQDKSFHLNLYAIDEVGDEVLMTKDHIIPVSKGGKDEISNYQTMCKLCNTEKGTQSNEEFDIKKTNM